MKHEIRQLKSSAGHTLINVLGLSMGCTSALVLFLLILHSTGYDTYHRNKDEIYRVVSTSVMNGNEDHTPGVSIPFIAAIKNDFPDVMVAPVSYRVQGRLIIDDQDRKVYEEDRGTVFIDENFYQLFDRGWIAGTPGQSLSQPDQVVLSRKMAQKYFGNLDVLGKSIEIENVGILEVSGVIEDFPEQKTDFPFDIIISYKTFEKITANLEDWGSVQSDFQCYLLLNQSQKSALESYFPAFADKYYGADRTDNKQHHLQPLADLHHSSEYSNYSYRSVTKGNIWGMGILGFFLVITACVNFINLSTAQATRRVKAIGIRKILGSKRSSLIYSFFLETGMVVFVSLLLAIGLSELALLKVNSFLDVSLSLNYFDGRILVFFTILWATVTTLSAVYPALIISKHPPNQAIKGIHGMDKGVGYFLRKSLVVFQFTISQLLIVGTIITHAQLNYFKEMSVGFQKEGIVNIEIPENTLATKMALKQGLIQLADTEGASLSYRPPASTSTSVTNVFYQSEGSREEINTQIIAVDKDFINVFELTLYTGSGLHEKDTIFELVVNETFVKEMGLTPEEAVGKMIHMWGQDRPISGVVKDFNTFSLAEKIMPVTLFTNAYSYRQVAVKVQTQNLTRSIEDIQAVYTKLYPGYGFNYQFMDEQFESFYNSEQRMSDLLMVFSGIAIFIGCLGLFGLVSYIANRKTKEIGIRKVLGASMLSVAFNFSKEFAILVLIAFLIAGPIAFFGMNSWLQSYENKIEITPVMFLSGVLLSLATALITILYKSVVLSRFNPVDALRDE